MNEQRPELLAPNIKTIPHELRAADQWVVWVKKWEERPELPDGGKWGKVPHNAANGRAASSTDPQTWNGFVTAASAYEKGRGRFTGVGFVLHEADPFAGIDLDHAIGPDRNLTPEAAQFVALLDSYTEVSPSGTGLRIFVRATLPPGGRKKGAVEMYEAGRFLTVTGRRWPGTPANVAERQAQVEAMHAQVWPPKPPDPEQKKRAQAAASTSREHLPANDHELLELAYKASNGGKIQRLFNGDTSEYNGDQSAADLALCSYLAFYTGDDPGRLDRLFRRSALMRDKWDRKARAGETYGAGTIRLALADCHEFYSPPGVRSEALENRIKAQFSQKRQLRGVRGVPVNAKWELPIPLDSAGSTRPFPTDALGGWLSPFVAAVAEATQTPPDLAGMMGLAAVAACVQTKAEIEGAPGWNEPLMLYTGTVAPPGARKSSVEKFVTAPHRNYERGERARLAPLRAEEEARHRILKARLAEAESLAVKGKTPIDRQAAEADALSYARELDAHVMPGEYRLFTEDCTPEKLPGLMQDNGGRMAVLSAEGDTLQIMAGRHSDKGPNLLIYKKGFTGEEFRSDRIGRKGEYIPSPALTLGIALQPSVLRELFRVPALRGEGLLGRFLYALPPSNIGFRKIRSQAPPAPVLAAYESGILRLIALRPIVGEEGEEHPHLLRLSATAQVLFDRYREETEQKLRPGEEMAGFADWGAKHDGSLLRVVALLHLIAGHAPDTLIGEETMRAGFELGAYFCDHARAAFAQMGADNSTDDAREVLAWIRRGAKDEFTEADAWRNFNHRFKTKEDVAACLEMLSARHFIRPREMEATEGPGRKPSQVYDVNPALFKDTEHATKLINLTESTAEEREDDEEIEVRA
jgi:hypothetical protein